MSLSLELSENKKSGNIDSKVSFTSPEKQPHLEVVCVIDESGSMNGLANIKGTDENENNGLTILDIVKHAVKTVIEILGPDDKLSLVGFTTHARTVMSPKYMTIQGKTDAKVRVDGMYAQNSTNIWGGLKMGLDILNQSNDQNSTKVILLLTDGVPNVNPPLNNYTTALANYGSKYYVNINTFGFGYNLNSMILTELADYGHGFYNFIPDASFVGTVFVNTMSNLKVVSASNISLRIHNIPMDRIKVLGNYHLTNDNDYIVCFIGNGQIGQSRDIVFELINYDFNSLPKLKIDAIYNVNQNTTINSTDIDVMMDAVNQSITNNKIRYNFVELLSNLTSINYDKYYMNELLSDFIDYLLSCSNNSCQGILEDAIWQVKESISREDWFNKWGKHYIPSLSRAHHFQVCNNFKDPGVQEYGGVLFNEIRDKADDVFLTIPPPTPTFQSRTNSSRPINMNTYHCSGNPCFHGQSKIRMKDNSYKNINEIKKGDIVYCPIDYCSKVVCVVKTKCENSKQELVILNDNIAITPWHPIRNKNEIWIFPNKEHESKVISCDYVYNLVLEKTHIVEIGGIQTCTLGHNLKSNDVISHYFFGTEKVVFCLMGNYGWANGLIEFNSNCLMRDHNNKIIGFLSR